MRRPEDLLAIRLLLIANAGSLAAIAALYALFGSRPGGVVISAVLGVVAACLFACLPLTNPRRRNR